MPFSSQDGRSSGRAADGEKADGGIDSGIDRRLFLKYLAAVGVARTFLGRSGDAVWARTSVASAEPDALARAFANPPDIAGPGAYWYWLGGNITREGITADLEAMRDAGISTPMLFAIGKSNQDTLVQPPADALTPLWWELLEHAALEAERLGLVLSMNCCDGWATASGPWITPELSMQHVVWTRRSVEGGKRVDDTLAMPPIRSGYYREIATIAVPYLREWEETSFSRRAGIETNLPLEVADARMLSDPENVREIANTGQPGWIGYTFDTPFTLRSVTVRTPPAPGFSPGVYRAANSLEVQASDDGKTFRRIGALEYPRHGWQTDLTTLTHTVPETTACYFRLAHETIAPQPYEEEYDFGQETKLRFFSIVLSSEPAIHHWQGKSAAQWAISRRTTSAEAPDNVCVAPQNIIDLSSKLDSTGRLIWDAPHGYWRVLRIGYTSTGSQNSAAGGAQGLECDKLSPAAAKLQFDHWFGLALQKVGPRLAGKILHVLHVDSWEAGTQNWSPAFAQQFRALRRYDLLPYIATLTGIPLASADVSERVLLDVRRTINDLMQTGFFQTLAGLAHQHGCILSAEPPNPTFPSDGMEHLAWVDWPMGEFWLNTPRNDKPTDIKDAVCGSRLYGKRIAASESFTQGLMNWDEHPFTFKALGDHMYCEGINRFMLHVYAQQPWLDRAPGMTLNGIGTFFSRTQTWWKPGKAWFDYLRRCQALLQEGLAVADVCYFTGENLPARALLPRQLSVKLPDGFAYDCINRDALLHQTAVHAGQLVLKSGGRYRVLVLPNDVLMTAEVALRIRDLVRAGAVIMGPRPEISPSLTDFPSQDATVRAVAKELWGDLDGAQRTTHEVGMGRVVWGKSLASTLSELAVLPDFELSEAASPVQWIHRRSEGWDLYFLSNQSAAQVRVEATFRVAGRRPELWHADCGRIEKLALWREAAGRTVVPLSLDPAGSVFVVFAQPTEQGRFFTRLAGERTELVRLCERATQVEAIVSGTGRWLLQDHVGSTRELAVRKLPHALPLGGPWRVRFAERLEQPVELTLQELTSWTRSSTEAVKYYSGTAIYTTAFTLSKSMLGAGYRLFLDLGAVHNLAEVRLNREHVTVLWKPPFTVDITAAARAGSNSLELSVTNTWRNRLIGDNGKGPKERKSFVAPMLRKGQPWLPGGPGVELSLAGLLGPVSVRFASVVRF